MTWINSDFTIDDAISKGFNTWDLLISDWGRLAAVDPTSHSFPAVGQRGLGTVQGVAIGDQSEIDRCFVAYSIEKMTPGNVTWDVAHRLSVGAPLMFPQVGTRTIVQPGSPLNPKTGDATLVIYPTGTSSIVANGGVSPTTFGATYIKADGSSAAFPAIAPLLHLVFYLTPPIVGAPTRRAPLSLSGTTSAAAGEHFFVIPTFGRKTLLIDMLFQSTNPAHTSDFRIATITNATNLFEVTQFADAAVPVNTPKQYKITSAFADFLLVYYTGVNVANDALKYTILASDD